ncbi:hydroxyacid dehydrogenase [Alphaproteobacteria bacterium]|nr:hydroxyacid dehydrogenase [Alphaproteobacteria bacterium]
MKIAVMGEIHPDGWKIFEENNLESFELLNFEENNLKKELSEVDAILLRTARLSNDVLSYCNKLKIISRHGVGYDNVNVDYLNKKNIALGITSTSNAISVAEHVLTSFLYLSKNIHLSDKLTREGRFNDKSSLPNFFELYQKNIVIFGFGRIGKAVAKRCLGFEANVYVYDPFVSKDVVEENNCKVVDKTNGLKIADYISIHLPLNTETKNFIDEQELSIMKETAIVVNTARGGIINEASLVNVLQNKKILGAGLDVFEKEPPDENHPLFNLDNVILSPHNAALTIECRKRMAVESAENIAFFLLNNKKLNLNNIVNKDEKRLRG